MDKKKKDKGILFRIWKGALKGEDAPGTENGEKKEGLSGADEKKNISTENGTEDIAENLEAADQDEAEEAWEAAESETSKNAQRALSDWMKPDGNYLKIVKQDYLNEEAEEQAYYSDFMLDGTEPDKDKKAFLQELQATAREYLETKESGEKGEDAPKAPVNAQVCIKISPDDMEVWMFIFPPCNGGKEASEELIISALECSNVAFGVDMKLVGRIVRKKRYLKMVVVAHGEEAVEGTEGKVTDHYPRIPYTSAEDQEKKAVDFKNLNWLHPVTAGMVICDVVFPVEGKDGSDVTGRPLKCKPLKKLVIPYGSNTELNENNQLISSIDGTLYYEKGKFHVKDVMNILSDVDLSVGNIDTIGNLEIRGDVLSGFTVQATGNIRIHGMVGCSKVIAGGNIKVAMGVKGCGEAILQAGGDIDCSYIESCIVKARGNITAGSIVNCEVSSDRNVESKIIVGGTIAALRQVHAKTVGNTQRRQTIFYLGNTQEVRNERIALEAELELLENSIEKLAKNVRYLQNKEERTLDEEVLCEQLQMELEANKAQVEKSKERIKEINDGINDFSQCELTANLIYPPATVTISGDTCSINQERSMCRIWMDEGEIVVS